MERLIFVKALQVFVLLNAYNSFYPLLILDFSSDDASPTNVRANVTSTMRVTVYWDNSPVNCDVFGYRLRITDDRMETTQGTVHEYVP